MKQGKKVYLSVIVGVLVIVFLFVTSYFVFVHQPYVNNQRSLNKVRNQLVQEHQLLYNDYFYKCIESTTSYIVGVKEEGKAYYYAFDEKLNEIDKEEVSAISNKEIEDLFLKKYKVKPQQIEIGYENNRFMFCTKYQDDNKLIYAYYVLSTGEFIRGQQL